MRAAGTACLSEISSMWNPAPALDILLFLALGLVQVIDDNGVSMIYSRRNLLLALIVLALTTTCSNPFFPKAYEVGDRGPAGGWIFYDKGRFSDGWRYMEAAPEDIASSNINWTKNSTLSSIGTDSGIGAGKNNTKLIMASEVSSGGAAQECSDYSFNGYKDWFLPSIDELELMYYNLHLKGLGVFIGSSIGSEYWSSSEYNLSSALTIHFFNGQSSIEPKNTGAFYAKVRSARRF